MERIDLLLLREVFRTRMEKEDFCIGQERVERLFRELLNEAEPEEIRHEYSGRGIKTSDVTKALDDIVSNGRITTLFEADDTFFANLRKRR